MKAKFIGHYTIVKINSTKRITLVLRCPSQLKEICEIVWGKSRAKFVNKRLRFPLVMPLVGNRKLYIRIG